MAAPFRRCVRKFAALHQYFVYPRLDINRSFLSSAFSCETAWNKRLQSKILQNIRMEDFYYELDKKLQREGKISAIDVDLFANSVKDELQLEELQDILHRFRRTPGTIHMLPSTPHAAIRTFMDFGQISVLMKILDDRLNYGIFPDYYCSLLMMDTFLKQGNYRDAAKVAILLMLQEDYGDPLCCHLALYSSYMYLQNPQPQPWDPDPPPVEEEPEEEVLVRVKYLRNPFFDDHFDLRDPQHLVGKTLALIGREMGDFAGRNCELIGLAMYNKWDRTKSLLSIITEGPQKTAIAKEAVEKIRELLETYKDGDDGMNEKLQEEFESLFKRLEEEGLICDYNLQTLLSENVTAAVEKFEEGHIENQAAVYVEWEQKREELLQEQIKEYIRQERIKKVEEKKKELARREQILFFFENKDKIDLQLEKRSPKYWKTHQNIPEHVLKRRAKIKLKTSQDYMPPEI